MVRRCVALLFLFSMTFSFTGLTGHLRTHFKSLHNLYMVLKERDTPPSADELAFASGHKDFTGEDQAIYIKALEARASTIASAFMRQEQASIVSYILRIIVMMETLLCVLPGAFRCPKVRASSHRVDCCLQPAVRRSGETGVHQYDAVRAPFQNQAQAA